MLLAFHDPAPSISASLTPLTPAETGDAAILRTVANHVPDAGH